MYLFKTSGRTFDSVIKNEKHAFSSMPKDWYYNELILVSKNKRDCDAGEKQIQYVMRLVDIRPLGPGEVEKYWPGNEGRWKYLFICKDTKPLNEPFNLIDLLGEDAKPYGPVVTFRKLEPKHETIIENYLRKTGTL